MTTEEKKDEDKVPWWSMTSQVEIYENERFWVGGGFSKGGLLPTDRRPYSTDDGSLSWKTLPEASTALLHKGWEYEDEEFLPFGATEEEPGVWWYSKDFSRNAMQNASAGHRRMTDFVRRRRLVRPARFKPDKFVPRNVYAQCTCADSRAIDALSDKMLDVLSMAVLLHEHNPQTVVTDAMVSPLKYKLIQTLGLGLAPASIVEPLARIKMVHTKLGAFPEEQQSLVSKTLGMFDNISDTDEHKAEIDKKYFSKKERDVFAGLVVRHLDPEHKLHCNKENCGEECDFISRKCANEGCEKLVSRKHIPDHDETCPFKIIPCTEGCGDEFPRNREAVHLREVCSLREVPCPLSNVGCDAILLAKDLEDHLVNNSNGHLVLAVKRMMEYQTYMVEMDARMERLEKKNEELRKRSSAGTTDIVKEMAVVSTKLGTLAKKVTHVDQRSNGEFKKIQRQLQKLERAHVK